jgi:hypothetical protein
MAILTAQKAEQITRPPREYSLIKYIRTLQQTAPTAIQVCHAHSCKMEPTQVNRKPKTCRKHTRLITGSLPLTNNNKPPHRR